MFAKYSRILKQVVIVVIRFGIVCTILVVCYFSVWQADCQ